MHLIHVVPNVDQEASGPSYSVTQLCAHLHSAEKVPLTLAVLSPAPDPAPTFLMTFPLGIGPPRLGRSPAMLSWLRAQVADGSCDIIHNHSLWMLPNLYPARAVRGTRCQLVVSPRGTLAPAALRRSRFAKRLLRSALVSPVLREANAFHATSEQEYRDIRALGLRQPVAILPNGIDAPDLDEVTPGRTYRRRLLFLGRIHPIKGIDDLLRAWSTLQSAFEEWELVIAGPGSDRYKAELEHLARYLRLERVSFIGPLYGHAKLEAFRAADLYVLPTRSENFGMTIAEALAAGTPVVTTKGAPWEELETEDAGWWIDSGVEPLTSVLREALSLMPDLLAAKGRQGRDWMLRDFPWKRIATNMARFYYWLCNSGPRPEFVRDD